VPSVNRSKYFVWPFSSFY